MFLRRYNCEYLLEMKGSFWFPHSTEGHSLVVFSCACVLSHFSHVWLCATPWTISHQAPLSMGFSRQEYWSGLPSPPPGNLPNLGIKAGSLMSPALAGGFFTMSTTWEAQLSSHYQSTWPKHNPYPEAKTDIILFLLVTFWNQWTKIEK